MKQIILLVFMPMFILSVSSCKYLQNHRSYSIGIDTLLDSKNYKTAVTDTTKTKIEAPVKTALLNTPQQPMGFGYGTDKYYMIVGSFLNQNFAEKYAEKIQQMGYHTQIIQSANSYYRVSAESYSSYRSGINQIAEFRSKIASKAWLHVKK
jgi:cell division protein FtsN